VFVILFMFVFMYLCDCVVVWNSVRVGCVIAYTRMRMFIYSCMYAGDRVVTYTCACVCNCMRYCVCMCACARL